MFGGSSSLSSSVYVPSVMPSRRFTGFSWWSMNNQTRPRDSTVGSGANSASIVCADCGAPYFGWNWKPAAGLGAAVLPPDGAPPL
jgi:hypothetical protein